MGEIRRRRIERKRLGAHTEEGGDFIKGEDLKVWFMATWVYKMQ